MKKTIYFIIVAFIATSCSTIVPLYEVKPLGGAGGADATAGSEGTVLFKVFSYEKSYERAKERAKIDAVHAVLFRGVGTNKPPLVKEEALKSHRDYFVELFGDEKYVDSPTNRVNISKTAKFQQFVSVENDGVVEPDDRIKLSDGSYKIGVLVSVKTDKLKKDLQEKGVKKKLGF